MDSKRKISAKQSNAATEKYPRVRAPTLQKFYFQTCLFTPGRKKLFGSPPAREGSAGLFDGRRKESRLRTFEIQVLPGVATRQSEEESLGWHESAVVAPYANLT